MLIIVLAVATALMAVWLFLLAHTEKEDWIIAAYNKILANQEKMTDLQEKDRSNAKEMAEYSGAAKKAATILLGGNSQKQIVKLQKENDAIQHGNMQRVDILSMPGFVLQRKYDKIATSDLRRKLLSQYTELYGKKYAPERTAQLLARMLSYPIIGVAIALMLGALLISCGNRPGGLAVMLVGALLIVVLTYALYDEVNDKLKKRRAAISRQFPNVVSKLALLVTSGMILDKAWKQTAESQDLVLYREMRKTVNEMDNLVEPTAAYTNFLSRCNTKETTKLASALIQSQSKGNAEIGALLKGMAHDAWQERRHTAKRVSEAANSKLMIPTIMLFIAILIMIMVPVAMNFTSL